MAECFSATQLISDQNKRVKSKGKCVIRQKLGSLSALENVLEEGKQRDMCDETV